MVIKIPDNMLANVVTPIAGQTGGAAMQALIDAGKTPLTLGRSHPEGEPGLGGFEIDQQLKLPYYGVLAGYPRETWITVPDEPVGLLDDPEDDPATAKSLIRINLNDGGQWDASDAEDPTTRRYPGTHSGSVSHLYLYGANAAANDYHLTAIDLGASTHIHDIKCYGIDQLVRVPTGGEIYLDNLVIEKVQCDAKPGAKWFIDTAWGGDGRIIRNIGFALDFDSYNPDGSPVLATARVPNGIRVRLCIGGEISHVQNGNILVEFSSGVTVANWHREHGQLIVRKSNVVVRDSDIYMRGPDMPACDVPPILLDAPEGASINPTTLTIANTAFIYFQDWNGGYSTETPNIKIHPDARGDLQIRDVSRKIRPNNELGFGPSFGITVDDNDAASPFNAYSHFASQHADWRNNHWDFSGRAGALPTTTDGLDTFSALTSEREWKAAPGTFFWTVVMLYDAPRRIGIVGANEVTFTVTTDGNAPTLIIAENVRGPMIAEVYRGTATGSYDKVARVPVINAVRLHDAGADIANVEWEDRTPGPVDPVNAFVVAAYLLDPGARNPESEAYGHCEVITLGATDPFTLKPTRGAWRRGNKVLLRSPQVRTYRTFFGWERATDCLASETSKHVANTDWVEIWGDFKVALATTAQLEAIGNAINATWKTQGESYFNTDTGKPVWAAGNAAGSVWINADGTTAHTPV